MFSTEITFNRNIAFPVSPFSSFLFLLCSLFVSLFSFFLTLSFYFFLFSFLLIPLPFLCVIFSLKTICCDCPGISWDPLCWQTTLDQNLFCLSAPWQLLKHQKQDSEMMLQFGDTLKMHSSTMGFWWWCCNVGLGEGTTLLGGRGLHWKMDESKTMHCIVMGFWWWYCNVSLEEGGSLRREGRTPRLGNHLLLLILYIASGGKERQEMVNHDMYIQQW